MEAVSAPRPGVSLVRETKSLSRPVHASFSPSVCPLQTDRSSSSSSRKNRLLCLALPVKQERSKKRENPDLPIRRPHQNDVDLTENAALRGALKVLKDDLHKQERPNKPEVRSSRGDRSAGVRSLAKFVGSTFYNFLRYSLLEDVNPYDTDNFAPVNEIGGKVVVNVISGAIPENFPAGTFIRTGPNPVFSRHIYKSTLGITKYRWFEGDGMLHAVYFEKRGDEYMLSYNNKYVEAEGYLIERQHGKPMVLPVMDGTPFPLFINVLLNQLRYGWSSKPTCNTSVWCHGGRVFAASENNLPYEINISDLSTMGKFDCNGAWPSDNFTAHPKCDPTTNELIFQGFSLMKPYNTVGVISADGETLLHTVDVGSERPGLNHDIMITERYTVVMDFPLLIDPAQITKGEHSIAFDHNSFTRFGIVPRFGDSNSVQWFQVETNAMFHTFNAYEDGNEVVVHGLRAKSSYFSMDMSLDQFRRGITMGVAEQEGYDPLVDGALLTYIREWRFNLEAGTVTERDIDDQENYVMMELPRINESYIGRKYRYAYAVCLDIHRGRESGLPYSGNVIKVDFSNINCGKGVVQTEIHDLGPNRHGGEPIFVAKPGSTKEDEGWILVLVYDRSTNLSEVCIIDAQKFTEEPVARILLPQRVPFGYHGTYVHAGRSS